MATTDVEKLVVSGKTSGFVTIVTPQTDKFKEEHEHLAFHNIDVTDHGFEYSGLVNLYAYDPTKAAWDAYEESYFSFKYSKKTDTIMLEGFTTLDTTPQSVKRCSTTFSDASRALVHKGMR